MSFRGRQPPEKKIHITTPPVKLPGRRTMPILKRGTESGEEASERVKHLSWFKRVTQTAPYSTSSHWYWYLKADNEE